MRELDQSLRTPPIEGVVYRNYYKARAVSKTREVLIPRVHLKGAENLIALQQLQGCDKNILFWPNHLSNIDAPVLEHLFELYGIENRLYVMGKKLADGHTKYLIDSVNYVLVWPQSIPKKNKEEEEIAAQMNATALRASHKVLDRHGNVIIFGEGTRSRDAVMHEFIEDSVYFTPRSNGLLVPVTLRNTEKVMPIDNSLHRDEVFVEIHKPISVDSAKYRGLPRKQKAQQAVHDTMVTVASGLPEHKQGVYRDEVAQRSRVIFATR